MNLRQWLLFHHKNIHFKKMRWMGIKTMKNPFDAWVYQEIIHDVKPEVIVEIGSAEGGSTLYLAHLLDLLGKGRVVSIDCDRADYHIQHDRIVEITGYSDSPDVIDRVAELCRGKSALVIHDGNHTRDQVLKDLDIYSKLVSAGSYLIVEDGIIDLFEPGDYIGKDYYGPLAAIEAFLSRNPGFIVDPERERYILTNNPKGFLKRIR